MNLYSVYSSETHELGNSMFSKSYSKDPFWLSLGLPVGVMHFSQDHPCFIMSGILEKMYTQISGAC